MNKKDFIPSMFAGCLLLAAFSPPAAADDGPYFAADWGQSRFSVNYSAPTTPGWTQSSSYGSASYRFMFGFQITPNWGVELGYVDLGHAEVTDSTKPSPDPSVETWYSSRIAAKGFFATGTGTWPIDEQWSLFARAGIIASEVDPQVDSNGNTYISSYQNQPVSAAEATYGVGVKWNIQPRWSLRLGWDHYHNLGDAQIGVNLLSLGVEFHFPTE